LCSDDASTPDPNHKKLESNFAANIAWDGKARLTAAKTKPKEQDADANAHVPSQAPQ
jgi:hypothetical protein